ncbi:glucose/galactose MFS transporter [Chitinophaga oryziterrae]|uniref:Glucose/galactose MFS transporter n=1 Tax=Chitinophaga oryziterrae TaxID=1031224 RepID=A0A6N8J3A0_9BACT|nr:sugar MFS transporter [Chitinophaga oryziterrae]MVT39650.1 glucose/galactose MFS transporter [Chitinophaga oryziterrae]
MTNTASSSLAIPKQASFVQSMSILGILYFLMGFITWVNGTMIQFLKIACELSTSQALLVTLAFFVAYFVFGLPASVVINKTGYKAGMAWSLAIVAIGCLIFIPAANSRSYGLFLTGFFVQCAGLALLQTASNPYASIIGPIESAAKRISILGICNKIAGAISPYVIGSIVLKNATALETQIDKTTDLAEKTVLLNNLASRVIMPYLVLAIVLIIIAFLINRSSLPEIDTTEEPAETGAAVTTKRTSIFQFPYLLLGVLCIFMYVGVEVMAGDIIGIYGKSLGMSLDKTKYFTSFTLVAMLVGYVIGIVTIPKYISQEKSLRICAILGLLFTTGAFLTTGNTAITFIALLGLANSLMWPAIFPLAISKLGRFTKIGSAMLVMGIVGGGVLPQIYGALANHINFTHAFFYCMIPGYIYILYYAMAGHKVGLR